MKYDDYDELELLAKIILVIGLMMLCATAGMTLGLFLRGLLK